MKLLILLSLISFSSYASFKCETEVDQALSRHNSRMEESSKLQYVFDGLKGVRDCLVRKSDLPALKKYDLLQKLDAKIKSIDGEYQRYYRLQSASMNELERDAYMNDASSFVYKFTKEALNFIKSYHNNKNEKGNDIIDEDRSSGKDIKGSDLSTGHKKHKVNKYN